MLIAQQTRKEWEDSQNWIHESTKRWHERTKRYPTNEDAIRSIRKCRTQWLRKPSMKLDKYWFDRQCHFRYLADKLVELIRESRNIDPIRTIYEFASFMDDMTCHSENPVTWIFACDMHDGALEILEWL